MDLGRKSNFVKFFVNLLLLCNKLSYLEPVLDSVEDFSSHCPDKFKVSSPSIAKVSM